MVLHIAALIFLFWEPLSLCALPSNRLGPRASCFCLCSLWVSGLQCSCLFLVMWVLSIGCHKCPSLGPYRSPHRVLKSLNMVTWRRACAQNRSIKLLLHTMSKITTRVGDSSGSKIAICRWLTHFQVSWSHTYCSPLTLTEQWRELTCPLHWAHCGHLKRAFV